MYEDDGEYLIQVWTDQDTTNKTIQLILQGIVPKFQPSPKFEYFTLYRNPSALSANQISARNVGANQRAVSKHHFGNLPKHEKL